MTGEDERTAAQPDKEAGGALKHPEAPDREAVEQHAAEGDGPFGADMQHVLGGTTTPERPEPAASPYSTGTDAATGGSVSAYDARSRFGVQGTLETDKEAGTIAAETRSSDPKTSG